VRVQKPAVLVTAAAGKTGMATALQLLDKGYPVRALVRRLDGRGRRLQCAGAEVVRGSMEDFRDLQASLAGVQRAYFCPPLEPGALRKAALFAAAAQEARLEVVVALSQWVVDAAHPSLHAREKWLAHKTLQWVPGVDVVTVNPGWFADNYMAALEPIAQLGLMSLPLGSGMNAPPSNEDIARVVVGALTNPGPCIGRSYRPTGPRLLSPDDIAATFARVLGRKVKYQDAPLGLFLKAAKALGLSDYVVLQLYWFLQEYQRNAFGIGAPSDAVEEVGGSPPEEFEQIVRRYVAGSSLAQRSIGSIARAIVNVMKGLVTRAPSLSAIAERMALPDLAHTTLAVESPAWLGGHATPSRNGRPTTGRR
jgi:uncharacterized protein YbjT (DUF2867 family)